MTRCRYARSLERDGPTALDAARRHALACEQCRLAVAGHLKFEAQLVAAGHRLAGPALPASTLAAARVFRQDGLPAGRHITAATVVAAVVVLAVIAGTAVGWLTERQPTSGGAALDPFDNRPTLEERIHGFEEQIKRHNLNPQAIVRLSEDYAVAAAAGESRVRVMELYLLPNGRPHARELAGSEHFGRVPTFNLNTSSGNTGMEWNTVFFGTAPANVSRVVVDGFDAEGGQVVGRVWVVMLRDKGVQPQDLRWRFIDAAGKTVLRGTGITPDN